MQGKEPFLLSASAQLVWAVHDLAAAGAGSYMDYVAEQFVKIEVALLVDVYCLPLANLQVDEVRLDDVGLEGLT